MTEARIYAQAADEQLMSWAAGGDRRAFDEIVARHGAFALRIAGRVVGDAGLAEDLAQEAMVRAWTRAARFDPQRARLTTWLYRIVLNLCIDESRKVRPASLPPEFDVGDPTESALDRLEAAERRAQLAKAIADLPGRQRAAIILVYDEGMSGVEAAEALGLSAKAVERLLARARSGLRAQLRTMDDRKGL